MSNTMEYACNPGASEAAASLSFCVLVSTPPPDTPEEVGEEVLLRSVPLTFHFPSSDVLI